MNVTSPMNMMTAEPVNLPRTDETIAVIGLGYVGLPVAIGLARHFAFVKGFDINKTRISSLKNGHDYTLEISEYALNKSSLRLSNDTTDLRGSSFFIVTVPTPIDQGNQPDLSPLRSACELIGPLLSQGAVVVFESTVYPGVTEDICGPILEQTSGLVCGQDFTLGYSPERINPGDTKHRLETIVKVVAGQDGKTLDRVAGVYGSLVHAGIHRAPSIKVAEAAKVIENTQRDVNIALMNEIALICDRLDIPSRDVFEAAQTKWNFLPFTPGLVGGHCIGVDPFYLTAKAQECGYHPEVILSGRRVNDNMGGFIAEKAVKMLATSGLALGDAKVAVLGLTFKENVPDLRNSKTFDVIEALNGFGINPYVHDPLADRHNLPDVGVFDWLELKEMRGLDLLVLAVPHREYLAQNGLLTNMLGKSGAIIDIRSALNRETIPDHLKYWSL